MTSSVTHIENGIEKYQEEKYLESIKEYSRVLVNDTNYATAQYEIALCHYQLEAFEESQEVLKNLLDYNIQFDFRPKVYVMLGNAYLANGETDKTIELYTEALKLYPYHQDLYYFRGWAYNKMEKYDLAMEDYMNSIQSNMFYKNAHLQLGLLAANQGYYAQALMSMITFTFIDPDDKRVPEVISIIERLSNGSFEAVKKDFKFYPDGNDPYEDYNILFENKIALQKKYKTKFTINTSFGNQLHLLLKTLDYENKGLEFWNAHYMKFLKQVWNDDQLDIFVMTCLVNIEAEDIKKTITSKINKIKAFYGDYIKKMQLITQDQYMMFEGKKQWVKASYTRTHLEYIGRMKEDNVTPYGNYYYYHPNGIPSILARVDDEGNPIGVWEFYNKYDGKLTKKVELTGKKDEKIQMYYHPSGELFLKHREIGQVATDTVTKYYRNGSISEQYILKDGKNNGFYKLYYRNGQLQESYNYVNDVLDGKYEIFHPNGKLSVDVTVTNGKINGVRKDYYPDGSLQEEYNFLNGERDGNFKEYYTNGKLAASGQYKAGKQVGISEAYFINGELKTKVELDESGKENGTNTWYDIDGKKYLDYTFVKGDLKMVTFTDKNGVSSVLAEKKGKKIDYKTNYPNGQLSREVSIIDGKKEGQFKYYDYYGNLTSVELYKNDELVDSICNYFSNGQIKSITHIANGKADGLYLEYNIFGDFIREGLHQDGEYHKEWYGYLFDGQKEYESYFLNGERHGFQTSYTIHGKLENWSEYDKGKIIANIFIDTNGLIIDRFGEYDGSINLHNPNGKYIRMKGNYKNGNADGLFEWVNPAGQTMTKGSYINDERSGDWKWYHLNGKLSTEVTYLNGERHGEEINYHFNGVKKSTYTFEHGSYEGSSTRWHDNGKVYMTGSYLNDERHGKWLYYNPSGELFCIRYYDQGIFTSYSYLDKNGNEVPPIYLKKNELEVKTYFKNGKLAQQHKRVNGEIEGKYMTYYSNGQIFEDNTYQFGEAIGKQVDYYPNGKLKSEIEYVKGFAHGKSIEYHANGQKEIEENYLYGVKDGEVLIYDETGKLKHRYLYFNDEIMEHEVY